ncbi:MAG: ISAzo13 family transposase, partial [Rectinemataceae bacterium]
LKVSCYLDHRKYPIGEKVSDTEMASLNIEPHNFHGEWNYTIKPRHSLTIV